MSNTIKRSWRMRKDHCGQQLRSHHCLSNISVSTAWWEQQPNRKCSRASEWKETDTKVDGSFFFFPFSNSFTFTDDPCLNQLSYWRLQNGDFLILSVLHLLVDIVLERRVFSHQLGLSLISSKNGRLNASFFLFNYQFPDKGVGVIVFPLVANEFFSPVSLSLFIIMDSCADSCITFIQCVTINYKVNQPSKKQWRIGLRMW